MDLGNSALATNSRFEKGKSCRINVERNDMLQPEAGANFMRGGWSNTNDDRNVRRLEGCK